MKTTIADGIMKRLFPIIIYTLTLTDTIGQIQEHRQDFFKQAIETIINDNKKHNGIIVISAEKIRWDTTYWTIKSYLTEFDTLDNEEFGKRQTPTNEIISEFSETDFRTFNEQIGNQDKDIFIKGRKIKGNKGADKFNTQLTIKFSQPLVSGDGDIIVVQQQIDSRFCFIDLILIYKKVDSKWIKKFEIKKIELCE
jgi:hypothetical protein